uniref:Uncharacterized protein n=1 Tax=Chelonoidis abingdonii TaxID=106734 RepID=A0A8C0IT43_CHEAB
YKWDWQWEQMNDSPPHPRILLLSDLQWGLMGCQLTAACCEDLSSVLSTNQTLTELELRGNLLRDSGVQLLCEGLKHANCKLQKLGLKNFLLTDACCEDLAAVLSISDSLTELELGIDYLRDSGVQLLCEGLKHPNCKLQKLGLWGCDLTADCCGDLSSALSTSQYLTELELGYNELGDAGVQLLCEGVKHPNCKLQKLGLEHCSLTAACCGDVSSALCMNQHLTELDIGRNKLGDPGVQLLCQGLKHPNCKLHKIRLVNCSLTAACCRDLSSVLNTKPTLTELDLSYKVLGNSGIKLLCEGLKHPNCKVQKLRVQYCCITGAACGDLAAVLRTNQSLTELNLNGNPLGDSGVQRLCEGLKHPSCKLQRLWLEACHLKDTCGRDLAAVLRTKQSLTELEMCRNYDLRETAVQQLCEGLRHPNCKLQRLIISVSPELEHWNPLLLRRLDRTRPPPPVLQNEL